MNANQKVIIYGAKHKPPFCGNTEPYRVFWNPNLIVGHEDDYIYRTAGGPYRSVILNTGVLNDYDPLQRDPEMLCSETLPVAATLISGVNSISVARGSVPITGLRIDHITDFAGANRRCVLPKVFQMRFISTADFPEMFLYKYNLDASGDTYVGVRIVRSSEGVYRVRLVERSVAGSPEIYSTYVRLNNGGDPGTIMTDTIRFAILDDEIRLYMGDPMVEQTGLVLQSMLYNNSGAYLEMWKEDTAEGSTTIPTYYGTDGLYIYDGYL